jgi:hypothetical protein
MKTPLVLALQFYYGDQSLAMNLARLIADIEPVRREGTLFVLVRHTNTPMTAEVLETARYVARKFEVAHFQPAGLLTKGYPDECYDIWAATVNMLTEAYYAGDITTGSFFTFECDGCPTSYDWLDRLQEAHAETLLLDKRVTGPVMRFPNYHLNGTLILEGSMWADRMSIHRCPPRTGWDCFHGPIFRAEANQRSQIIQNLYGMREMSESVFWTVAREAAWITSVKDGLHHHWARKNLVKSQSWRKANDDGSVHQ